MTRTAAVSSVDAMEGALQATRDACAKITPDVTVSAVLTVLGTRQDERVLLVLESPGSVSRVQELVRQLEEGLGAGQVETLLANESLARLRVTYDGPMLDFVDYLSTGDYEGKTLTVHRAVGREVVARFGP
jgi:hypothetical protein